MRHLIFRVLPILAIGIALASFLFPHSTYAASTGRYHPLTSDGTLYASDDNYTTAQTNVLGTVEYTTTGIRIGQDNVTGNYYVWRGVLFFDTQELPIGAIVSSAQVTFWTKTNGSGTDFNIILTQPGDMHSPMEDGDYYVCGLHTDPLADAVNTVDYDSSMTMELNGDGLAAIMRDGITVFAMRSEEDVDVSAPSGSEYIDIYSSESPYPPVLTVHYYMQSWLGEPDTKDLTSVAVFSGYYEVGDQLFVGRSNITYDSGAEDLNSFDYFSVQIWDNSTVVASTPLWSWGYVPVSIYLSAANALPAGTYSMVIIGQDGRFETEIEPYVSHTIDTTEYKGTDLTGLDAWVMATAIDIGRQEKDDVDYYRIQVSGKWKLNDAGGDMFIAGIPLLNSIRSHLFANPGLYSEPTEHDDSYEGTLWDNWGTSFTEDWELIGQIGNVSGVVVVSLAFLALGGWVVIEVQKQTGKAMLGMIPAVGVLLLGSLLGVPFWIILGASALGAAYFLKEMLLGGTA